MKKKMSSSSQIINLSSEYKHYIDIQMKYDISFSFQKKIWSIQFHEEDKKIPWTDIIYIYYLFKQLIVSRLEDEKNCDSTVLIIEFLLSSEKKNENESWHFDGTTSLSVPKKVKNLLLHYSSLFQHIFLSREDMIMDLDIERIDSKIIFLKFTIGFQNDEEEGEDEDDEEYDEDEEYQENDEDENENENED